MVKKHRSEIFLDKHIWYKITHSSVRRDNLVRPQHRGTLMQEGVPSQGTWTGHFFSATAQRSGSGIQKARVEFFSFCITWPTVFSPRGRLCSPGQAEGRNCCGDVLTVSAQSSLRYPKPDWEQNKRLRGAGPLHPPLRISSPGITLRANGAEKRGLPRQVRNRPVPAGEGEPGPTGQRFLGCRHRSSLCASRPTTPVHLWGPVPQLRLVWVIRDPTF